MSTILALIGPIEFWWNTDDEPFKFMSPDAIRYRLHREALNDFLVENGYLCFRPHSAFKGPWDLRAQVMNDTMIEIADVVVCMRPDGVPGSGTDGELDLADKLGKPVVLAPPYRSFFDVLDDIKETEHGR